MDRDSCESRVQFQAATGMGNCRTNSRTLGRLKRVAVIALVCLVGRPAPALSVWHPYNDGFEGQAVGEQPAGWDGDPCAVVTDAQVHAGTRAIRVSNDDAPSTMTVVELSDLPEEYKFRFYVNFEEIAIGHSYHTISFRSGSMNELVVTVLDSAGVLVTSDAGGSSVVRDAGVIEAGQWYQFSYEIDAVARTYRLAIDNVPLANASGSLDFSFRSYPGEDVAGFSLACTGDQGYSAMHVDDVTMPVGSAIDFAEMRSVCYYNVATDHQTSWTMTAWFDALKADLPLMKAAGFNTVWLVVPWADFQPSINPVSTNQGSYDLLAAVAAYFKSEGLYLILPHPYLGTGWAPTGYDHHAEWPFGDDYLQAFKDFMYGFVDVIKDYDNILVLLHHEGYFNNYSVDNPIVKQAMMETYQTINPDIEYWNAEFGFSYSSFDEIPVPGPLALRGTRLFIQHFRLNIPPLIDRLKDELGAKCAFGIHDWWYLQGFISVDTCIPGNNNYDVYSSTYYPGVGAPNWTYINDPATGLNARMARAPILQLNIPVIFGETGLFIGDPPIGTPGVTEQIRADWYSGCAAWFLANGIGYDFWGWEDFVPETYGRGGFIDEFGEPKLSYYAMVDAVGHLNAVPGAGSGPRPAHGETDVHVQTRLHWDRASNATMYDVHFGTSADPPLVGRQVAPLYKPSALTEATTYYWKADAVNPAGTTPGPVWSFTTGSESPFIRVSYPDGGEDLDARATVDITWQSLSGGAGVNLEYSTTGGASWNTIASGAPNTGSWSWDLPDVTSRQCLVRVTDAEHPEATDTSDAVFSIIRPEDRLRLRVTGIDWWSAGTLARIHYEANQPVGRYYTRLYQLPGGYGSTSSTASVYSDLDDGYYLFVATARDADGYFAADPCRVWFLNRTWGDEFQVYLAQYEIAGDSVTFSYASTTACARYYTRLYGVESAYTSTASTSCTYTGLADGIFYFVVTGKAAESGQFPPGGPARQFFYIDTFGFGV